MYNGQIAPGFIYQKMLNEDLTWEKTGVFNLGLDLAFFSGRLTAEFDYYDRLTEHRGKHHYVALSAVARKLCGVILALLRERRTYERRPPVAYPAEAAR